MAKKKQPQPVKLSFLERMDSFFEKNSLLFFWIILGVTALLSIGLFDPRISLGGDDAVYITQANNFIKNFTLHEFQGPLYPVVISPIVFFFGTALFPIKLFSFLSILGCLCFTFFAFRKRIPATLLITILALFSINSSILYYASQSYSEAFYMFLQSATIFVFFKHFIDRDSEKRDFVISLKSHLWLALALLAVCMTRSVGFALVMGVCAYFLFYREWKNLFMALGCFLLLFVAYTLLKNLIWGGNAFQFSGQGSMLLQKDAYHPAYGNETFSGFFVRFWKNSIQYLSNGFYRIIGFDFPVGENSIFRMSLVYILSIGGLCFAYIKNKYLFFTSIASGIFLVVTFFALQVAWNQERLIIPVVIFVLMAIFGFFYYLLSTKKLRSFQFLFLLPFFILFFKGIGKTVPAIEETQKITDAYSNLTPDWINYLRASEWAANNLSKDQLVAARKPDISTIYAKGKPFYGIAKVPTGDIEVFFNEWENTPDKYTGIKASRETYGLYNAHRTAYKAVLTTDTVSYWIVGKSDLLTQQATQLNIPINSYDEVKKACDMTGKCSLFYADTLLNILQRANVTHILTARLRTNPAVKTDRTINTVERYAYQIQEKYPAIFELVYQQGTTGNEEAQIIKINWDLVKKNEETNKSE